MKSERQKDIKFLKDIAGGLLKYPYCKVMRKIINLKDVMKGEPN